MVATAGSFADCGEAGEGLTELARFVRAARVGGHLTRSSKWKGYR